MLKERFELPTHDQIVEFKPGSARPNRRCAAISFDDGLRECFDVVRPLLLEHRAPCTFYLITDAIDNRMLMFRNKASLCLERWNTLAASERSALRESISREFDVSFHDDAAFLVWIDRLSAAQVKEMDALCEAAGVDVAAFLKTARPYMTRDQILQLHRDGFTIGAHTRTHPRLWEMSDPSEIDREIVESCAAIRDLTGQPRVPFAFPFNGLWMDRDRIDIIRKKCGFIDLVFDTNNLMKDRDFMVNRIWVDSPEGAVAGRSNLPRMLRRAHALEPIRAMKRMM